MPQAHYGWKEVSNYKSWGIFSMINYRIAVLIKSDEGAIGR
jgi:hypothetical protein